MILDGAWVIPKAFREACRDNVIDAWTAAHTFHAASRPVLAEADARLRASTSFAARG